MYICTCKHYVFKQVFHLTYTFIRFPHTYLHNIYMHTHLATWLHHFNSYTLHYPCTHSIYVHSYTQAHVKLSLVILLQNQHISLNAPSSNQLPLLFTIYNIITMNTVPPHSQLHTFYIKNNDCMFIICKQLAIFK